MKTAIKNRERTEKLVLLALLTAMVAILSYFGGFIKIGGLASVSLTLIPVVLGAAMLGPWAGALLGGISGIVFFITPDAAFWFGLSLFGTVVTVLIKGIAAGFLESALGGIGVSFLPLIFFMIGYGTGHLAGRALARTFPSYMIFSLALCILRPAVTLAAIGLDARATGFDLTAITRGTLAPEFLVNLVVAIPMYPLIRKTHKLVQQKK